MKKGVAIIMILALLFSGNLSISGKTEKINHYVALGDSIATGYGLTDLSQSYVRLIGEKFEISPKNYAVNGMDTTGLLALLREENGDELRDELKKADLITVSIGGNNVLKPLMAWIREEFSVLGKPLSELSMKEIYTMVVSLLKNQVQFHELEELASEGVQRFQNKEFQEIISTIKELNPGAHLIVQTIYDPFINFPGDLLRDLAGKSLKSMNDTIMEHSMGGEAYDVARVELAFLNDHTIIPKTNMLKLDPHPTIYGHGLIFQAIDRYLPQVVPFDDVENHWALEEISFMTRRGLFSGVDEGIFAPDITMTNGMFAEVLRRLDPVFLQETGLSLKDTSPLLREDLVLILADYLKTRKTVRLESDRTPFYSDWNTMLPQVQDAVELLTESGIINGKADGAFHPKDHVTRAEAAAVIARVIKLQ